MSREHHSAIKASFLKSSLWQSVVNKQPVKERIMWKWKLSHWGSLLSFRLNIYDYEERNVNNHNEEKKSPLLYCSVVLVNRKSGSGRVTVVWINKLGPEMFIYDEKFFLTACFRSSRSIDKDSNGSIHQWGILSVWKTVFQVCPGNFDGLSSSLLSESNSFKCT